MFPGDVQRLARGSQDLRIRAAFQNLVDQLRRAIQDVLAVVDDQQQHTRLQGIDDRVGERTGWLRLHAERSGDSRRDGFIAIDRRQFAKPDARREILQIALRDLQREARLAHAACADQRQQTAGGIASS